MNQLHITEWGAGEPVLMVHGSGPSWGAESFAGQRELAEHYRLLLVDRRGYGDSPAGGSENFEVDASDLATLLGDGVHLVGHSYGAVSCLLVAGRLPGKIRSLTVIEPPAGGVARGDEAVETFIQRMGAVYAHSTEMTPEEFASNFLAALGLDRPTALSLPDKGFKGLQTTIGGRPPWEAQIPLDELASARFPKLVVSGGWKKAPPLAQTVAGRAFNRICDVIAERIGAERFVVPDANHSPHSYAPVEFNHRLSALIESSGLR